MSAAGWLGQTAASHRLRLCARSFARFADGAIHTCSAWPSPFISMFAV